MRMAENIECPPPLMSSFTGLTAGKFPVYFAAAGTPAVLGRRRWWRATVEKLSLSDQAGGALCGAK